MQFQARYWLLPAIMVLLGLISIVTLRSVAAQYATQQLIFLAAGLGIFWFVSRFSFSFISQYRWFAYLALVVLLVLTLLVGSFTRNTRRWISVGGLFSIQGSQLAAPVIGLAAAHFVAEKSRQKSKNKKQQSDLSLKDTAQLLGILALPAILIVVAPDLGSTIFYLGSISVILLFGPISWRLLGLLLGGGLLTAVVAWFFILQPYQKDRIYCFISPALSSTCSTYNAEQSLIAVGSGQLFGRGLGKGVQSHLQFLPERQTDFIFASFAEEWGLIGSLSLIGLFTTLVGYIVYVGLTAHNKPAYYYCLIIASLIAFQSGFHIGMNMYLFPIKGISLPFVSYGGSSLIGMTLGLAIVQSIAYNQKPRSERHFS
jgi:rod shape determining protein RodA